MFDEEWMKLIISQVNEKQVELKTFFKPQPTFG